MTDGHVIIYGTGGDSQRPELKWDGESGNLEHEIGDVKESLVSVNQQIGDLKNRVEELQNSVEGRKTTLLNYILIYKTKNLCALLFLFTLNTITRF
jgi:hypothetical protein